MKTCSKNYLRSERARYSGTTHELDRSRCNDGLGGMFCSFVALLLVTAFNNRDNDSKQGLSSHHTTLARVGGKSSPHHEFTVSHVNSRRWSDGGRNSKRKLFVERGTRAITKITRGRHCHSYDNGRNLIIYIGLVVNACNCGLDRSKRYIYI